MTAWVLINLVLSASVLLTVLALRDAPARLKLWLCVVAMVCWCLPLQPITLSSSPPLVMQFDIVPIDTPVIAPLIAAGSPAATSTALPWSWLLAIAVLAGLAWFALDCWRAQRQLKQWRRHSRPDDALLNKLTDDGLANVSVAWLPNCTTALTSGVLRPTIWLGEQLQEDPELPIIVLHELTHARQRDNAWLTVITLIQRVHWWNPLVWLLAHHSRQLLELSCDEACARRHGQASYQSSLGNLLARSAKTKSARLALAFFSRPAFSVRRLQHLSRTIMMKKRYWLSIAALTAIGGVTLIQADNSTLRMDQDEKTQRSYSSVSLEDDGSLSWWFQDLPVTSAVQSLAKFGDIEVLGHPKLSRYRVTSSGTGTAARWQEAVDVLLGVHEPDLSSPLRYWLQGKTLHLIPTDVERDDTTWLEDAIRAEYPKPPEPPAAPSALSRPTRAAMPLLPEPAPLAERADVPAAPKPPEAPEPLTFVPLTGVMTLHDAAALAAQELELEASVFPGFGEMPIRFKTRSATWRDALDQALPPSFAHRVRQGRLLIGPSELIEQDDSNWLATEQTPVDAAIKLTNGSERFQTTIVLDQAEAAAQGGWTEVAFGTADSASLVLKVRHAMLSDDRVMFSLSVLNRETGEPLSNPRLVAQLGQAAELRQTITKANGERSEFAVELTASPI